MNWALIGASTIAGQYLVDAITAQAGGRVGWVVSGNADHAKGFALRHGIPHATDRLEEALADPTVEAVYVSSRNDRHLPQALAAIAAGKHVLCEKPLALTSEDAAGMIRAAEAGGVVLSVNHHMRAAGSHRAVRGLIAAGRVGRVLSARVLHAVQLPEHLRGWRLDDPGAGGGVIADLTVHNADIVRFLLDEDPATVVAESAETGMGQGVEDSAMSVWTMPSGAMVFSHESFTHPFTQSGLEVHGTEGSILAPGILAQDPVGRVVLVDASGREEIAFDTTPIYEVVVREFEPAARTGSAPAATGTDGLKSLIVAEAVRRSARTGERVEIAYGVAA